MKVNKFPTEVLDVVIESIDEQGYGYARYIHAPDKGSEGKRLNIYVTNVVPGDKVRVTIVNAKGRGRATVDYDELLEAGPSRNLEIPTEEGYSGGAPLQYMKYENQLEFKTDLVKKYLKGKGFDENLVKPIIGMSNPTRYRNKMELSFGKNGELGMFQQGNYKRVIDLKDSILMPEIMLNIKNTVSQWQKDHDLIGYDKETHTGLLRNLMIRQSFATSEVMVVLFASEPAALHTEAAKDFTNRLVSAFPEIESIQWSEFAESTERIQSESVEILYGRDYINEELSGFKYRLWPQTFFQATPVQAEKLVELAIDLAEVDRDMKVLDLFCGVGTFSLPLAKQSKALAGIEIVDQSIQSAILNAKDNNIENTYFMTSDARKGLTKLQEVWGKPDMLLLDPPRSGAGGKVMRSIGRFGTDKVVYVSCNPKSLAEDLVWLLDFGYEPISVQPVDQFPHTTHVETIVLLQRADT